MNWISPTASIKRLVLVTLLAGAVLDIIPVALAKNKKPEIHLGLAYSEKKSVVVLAEDTPKMSIIALMEVKDNDTGPAGEVSCAMDNEYVKLVTFSSSTFKVEISKELDYETTETIDVRVTCHDRGSPPLTATAHMIIEVKDVNDNGPTFSTPEMAFEVLEGEEIGTFVGRVTATDADTGENAQICYSLFQESGVVPFTIDNETGIIITDAIFDRESVQKYNFTVLATDVDQPSYSSHVTVKVKVVDANDNAPVILTKRLSIQENQKAMTSAGRIRAEDIDEGKNADLVFAKVEESDEYSSTTPFLVDPNGNILSVVSLDREQKSQYSMLISVKDKGFPKHSSTATLVIVVEDVNDNVPVITSPCLSEDEDDYDEDLVAHGSNGSSTDNYYNRSGVIVTNWYNPGAVVYQVKASDKDEGENARLSYAILSVTSADNANNTIPTPKEPLFQINKKTGEITLRRYVESRADLNQIVNINVSDQGGPAHSARCMINVIIDVELTEVTTISTTQKNTLGNGSPSYTLWPFQPDQQLTFAVVLLISSALLKCSMSSKF